MMALYRWCAVSVAALGLASASVSVQAQEEVLYLLPAPAAQVAFAPWMLAQHRGYYAAEGLKVTFQPGRGGVDVAKQIGAGNAPIGGAFGDTPVIVRSQGVPVKAVAVLGGRSMTQLTVHEDSAIRTPKDLKGKTITAMTYAAAATTRCSACSPLPASARAMSMRRRPARRGCGNCLPRAKPTPWPPCRSEWSKRAWPVPRCA